MLRNFYFQNCFLYKNFQTTDDGKEKKIMHIPQTTTKIPKPTRKSVVHVYSQPTNSFIHLNKKQREKKMPLYWHKNLKE